MIYVVLGTKAQLIKMAPVMVVLQSQNIPYRFIFTGQHQETISDLQANFGVKNPDLILHSGKDITSIVQMFFWLLKISYLAIAKRKQIFPIPNGIVLVHGDTFSTLAGALMGKLARQKVGHVESGLRSFNLFHPFPEELTRLLTFCLADYYFCPGAWAVKNLKNFPGPKINTQYNTLLDALTIANTNAENLKVVIPEQPYCVVTMHRFENLYRKDILLRVLGLIEVVAQKVPCIFILHPITKTKLIEYGLLDRLISNPRFELRPRYDYFNFMKLVEKSEFVLSDGGSNQEECFYMGKPVLLLRKVSERQEGIGQNVVISEYRTERVESFLQKYLSMRTPPIVVDKSPSQIIVDGLRQHGFA